MSADRWSTCPKCKKNSINAVESAYGKVTELEYRLLLADERRIESESNLREDWEIAMDDEGNFSIAYYCSCEECGFSFTHKYSEKVVLS